MINIDNWMTELTCQLKNHFESRLLFVGLQGSYRREEAHKDSDIDAVVILDVLSIEDLIAYRKILLAMPENDKSCGFISGKQELRNWPKHELFQFERDTYSYYGALNELLPDISRQNVIDSVKISASGLYHLCCHTAIHSPLDMDALRNIYKTAFFLLQGIYYLQNDIYIGTKKELLPLLTGDQQEILNISMHWDTCRHIISENPNRYYDLILRWSSEILNTYH